jgi:hypothetical protein
MTYSLMIQAVADANLADARQRADRARRARQARATAGHAPRRRTSHTVAAMSRLLTTSSHAPSVS